MGASSDIPDFLRKYRLSNCLSHLQEHGVKTFEDLKKMPVNDLKAIGFKPEVRSKLQKALQGHQEEAKEDEEEERFVTVDEEDDAIETGVKSGSGKAKKKKGKKAGDKAAEGANKSTVPGESGVCLDDSFAEMLTTIGLGNFIKIFEQNNITNLASCRYVTREALVGNFGIPSEKAGLLLSNIFQSAPGVARERRLPDLAFDLASCVASMKVTDVVRQQVKTSLQTNNVLSVNDARNKRFALMNEVGLSADCATELGHLLDSTPAQMAMPTPAQGNWGAYNQRQTAR